jgi:hypothetical protein
MFIVPIKVQQSPIEGLGVFAAEFIRKGTVVWQFDPGVDKRHPVAWVSQQPAHVQRFFASYGVKSLDQQTYYLAGDQTLFVNHSDRSNMAPDPAQLINGEEVVVATRDIQPGDEMTINYGEIDGADREKVRRGVPLFGGT